MALLFLCIAFAIYSLILYNIGWGYGRMDTIREMMDCNEDCENCDKEIGS